MVLLPAFRFTLAPLLMQTPPPPLEAAGPEKSPIIICAAAYKGLFFKKEVCSELPPFPITPASPDSPLQTRVRLDRETGKKDWKREIMQRSSGNIAVCQPSTASPQHSRDTEINRQAEERARG